MSITYASAIVQFLILMGVLTQEEANIVSEGLVAVVSPVALLVTLYGRYRANQTEPIDILGFRK